MDAELEKNFFTPFCLLSDICWFCIWNGKGKEESKTIRKREAEADQQQTQGQERRDGTENEGHRQGPKQGGWSPEEAPRG